MTQFPAVALLGLGEAGSAIGADLVALGARVSGWDPDPARALSGAARAGSPEDAVADADVVLSLNAQAAAVAAAESVAGVLVPRHLYADLNAASAEVKRQVARVVERSGAAFVDVALLAPVPGRGLETPCLASGSGAARFAEAFGPLGMHVEVLDDGPGAAATRKLLRSVFMKGLAASVLESVAAARTAGCEDWLRGQIVAVLDDALVERLVTGSETHAERRVEEMEAAAALLRELGVAAHVTEAAARVLKELTPARGSTGSAARAMRPRPGERR